MNNKDLILKYIQNSNLYYSKEAAAKLVESSFNVLSLNTSTPSFDIFARFLLITGLSATEFRNKNFICLVFLNKISNLAGSQCYLNVKYLNSKNCFIPYTDYNCVFSFESNNLDSLTIVNMQPSTAVTVQTTYQIYEL